MPRSASRPKANRSGAPRSRRPESRSLRERLAEAEQTVEAIRTGGVDALVVSGLDGEQIYTLQGADHAYRVLVETLQAGPGWMEGYLRHPCFVGVRDRLTEECLLAKAS